MLLRLRIENWAHATGSKTFHRATSKIPTHTGIQVSFRIKHDKRVNLAWVVLERQKKVVQW